MLVSLTDHVLFCFKEIQLPKYLLATVAPGPHEESKAAQSLIPVITSGKVCGILSAEICNLFKTIHVIILFCVLSLSPFLITEHIFVLFVCLFVGVCFYSANFDRAADAEDCRTCEGSDLPGSPSYP